MIIDPMFQAILLTACILEIIRQYYFLHCPETIISNINVFSLIFTTTTANYLKILKTDLIFFLFV